MGNEHPTILPTENDERIYQHGQEVTSMTVREENTKLAYTFMVSEDFAFYQEKVLGSFLLLGVRNEKTGSIHPAHSPYFSIDEDVLPTGAIIHAAFAYSYLLNSTRIPISYS